MLNDEGFQERRRAPRYAIRSLEELTVLVSRPEVGGSLPGRLIDLSSVGAKVGVADNLRFSERVLLRFASAALQLDAAVDSTAAWVRPHTKDEWLVGLAFAEGLPGKVIDQLAMAGILERRRHPRHIASIFATCRWQLSARSHDVEIIDYSAGGFCMACQHPGADSANVLMRVPAADGEATIYGRVCWRSARHGKYVMGCEFKGASENGRGAALLRDAAELAAAGAS
jgi:hypothetical protein